MITQSKHSLIINDLRAHAQTKSILRNEKNYSENVLTLETFLEVAFTRIRKVFLIAVRATNGEQKNLKNAFIQAKKQPEKLFRAT